MGNVVKSGESSLSEADIKVARDLIRAGQLLKLELLDHVIIGDGNFTSLRSLGCFYLHPAGVSDFATERDEK